MGDVFFFEGTQMQLSSQICSGRRKRAIILYKKRIKPCKQHVGHGSPRRQSEKNLRTPCFYSQTLKRGFGESPWRFSPILLQLSRRHSNPLCSHERRGQSPRMGSTVRGGKKLAWFPKKKVILLSSCAALIIPELRAVFVARI